MAIRDLIRWPWGKEEVQRKAQEEHPILSLQREMNQVFDRYFRDSEIAPFGGFGLESLFSSTVTPKVDVSETADEIQVTAELPGMDQDDLDVTLSEDGLTIRGEKKQEKEEKKKEFHRVERSYGSFHRHIPLLAEVDREQIEAEFKKGVLTVKLRKTDDSQATRITVTGQ